MVNEKLGEIFVDGRIINLDNASIEVLDSTLNEINLQKEKVMNRINKLLAEIQN